MRQQSSTGLSSRDPLIALLQEARVGKSSLIRVTGRSGLAALLWLCRQGFERVGYMKPGHETYDQPDVLIVAHTCDEAGLDRLLDSGPHVREGGVLIFQSPLPHAGPSVADPIHRRLEDHGYAVERCLHGHRRELHVARRRPARLAKAA